MTSEIPLKVHGQMGQLEDWSQIDWQKVNKTVRNLRRRIFRARKLGQWKQLRRLQKLMLKSYANLLLSVRQITQINNGRNTAGIDGKVFVAPQERVELVNEWTWSKALPTKRVYIAKSNGKQRCTKLCGVNDPARVPRASGQTPRRRYAERYPLGQAQTPVPTTGGTPATDWLGNADQERERAPRQRPLGIPVVGDRIEQAMVKNALEPEWEAVFEPNSYGFRPGRSCHDAIEQCFSRLCKGRDTWVLDADIKGFFDNIAHSTILDMIEGFPAKESIKEWLEAGCVHKGHKTLTDKGTPQGGVISPLLANIGLHGLENLLTSQTVTKKYKTTRRSGKNIGKVIANYVKKPKLNIIRYADDFVVTADCREYLEEAQNLIKEWLSQRGLEINEAKTRIVNVEEGFNFLGFNVRSYQGKLLIKPQKEKVLQFCKKIGEIIKSCYSWTQINLIKKLNPILVGFANYYRGAVSKDIFSYVSHRVWGYLWRWAKRRHPKKGRKWVYNRYFRTYKGQKWTFMCEGTNRSGKEQRYTLTNIARDIPIVRHIKVKGSASPDDPSLKEYWEKRYESMGKKLWARGSKYELIARKQGYRCPVCNEPLFNGERIETHHIVAVKDGGSSDIENLIHLHSPCHKQEHSKTSKYSQGMTGAV